MSTPYCSNQLAKRLLAKEKTINYINEKYPDIFTIADAKRGDIGNTSTMYAKAFFEDLAFDSVTVAPYMGKDSVEPFLAFKDKHTILLALTSNQGAFDFQTKQLEKQEVYKEVLEVSKTWKNSENLMYVVGATKAEYLADIRKIVPDSFLLVPGVGKIATKGEQQEQIFIEIDRSKVSNQGLTFNNVANAIKQYFFKFILNFKFNFLCSQFYLFSLDFR